MASALSDTERTAWLRLSRTQNVGPVTFTNLIARFTTASDALRAVPHLAKRGGAPANLHIPSERDAQTEIAALAKLGGRFIAACEADYPHGLAALDAPPPLLAVLGNAHLLTRDMVAIVGARNASALGRKFASRVATDLGTEGLVIASGLARGIDAAAHEAALTSGTCAVVAGGVDTIYPPENRALYERIAREGVIVSEMPMGLAPLARHFPRRNRIISGLSRGVVIVEAAARSGSLITAKYAANQGREIFAVPGSPLDPRAAGANRLIRDGATLIENAGDVLDVLRPILGHAFREPDAMPRGAPMPDATDEAEADRIRAQMLELLGPAPVATDELIRLCGATPAAVLVVLLELELAGRLHRHPGNQVSLA